MSDPVASVVTGGPGFARASEPAELLAHVNAHPATHANQGAAHVRRGGRFRPTRPGRVEARLTGARQPACRRMTLRDRIAADLRRTRNDRRSHPVALERERLRAMASTPPELPGLPATAASAPPGLMHRPPAPRHRRKDSSSSRWRTRRHLQHRHRPPDLRRTAGPILAQKSSLLVVEGRLEKATESPA